MPHHRGRVPPRPRGDPFRIPAYGRGFGSPMAQTNQMVRTTTGVVIGAGTLMLGFGALNMLGGMVRPPP